MGWPIAQEACAGGVEDVGGVGMQGVGLIQWTAVVMLDLGPFGTQISVRTYLDRGRVMPTWPLRQAQVGREGSVQGMAKPMARKMGAAG